MIRTADIITKVFGTHRSRRSRKRSRKLAILKRLALPSCRKAEIIRLNAENIYMQQLLNELDPQPQSDTPREFCDQRSR